MMKARTQRFRILIVDDHPLMRRGFSDAISEESALEVCGEASSADEAWELLKSLNPAPELMIVDLALPGMSGLDLLKKVAASRYTVRMLVASMHDESLFAERCLRAGAMGYVSKAVAPEQMVEAIHHVLDGEVYLSPKMTRRLLKGVARGGPQVGTSSVESLSDRELEVFSWIGRGMTTRAIAEKLHLSVKTIETYRENIKNKLGVRTSAELMRRAVQWVLENG
jgi:DNA-binding NarL/FixJ family response regulator